LKIREGQVPIGTLIQPPHAQRALLCFAVTDEDHVREVVLGRVGQGVSLATV
jgi:hypothetical protein